MKTMREFILTLVHFGPIATLLIVKTVTLSVTYCSLMYWPPADSVGGLLSLTSFLLASGLVLFNFFCSISSGPGYLPFGWEPEVEDDKSKLQYCSVCKGYKSPRAHHCRKCGRCIMKLDHHCPWINSCVGHKNHCHFIFFLLSAVWGCTQGAIILGFSLYHAVHRTYYIYHDLDMPFVYLGVYGFVWCLFSMGCAIGVVLGVGILLYYQAKVVFKNQTTIEEWIVEKAEFRRSHHPDLEKFVYPYHLGRMNNFLQVINISCEPIGDGYTWPVVSGCDQYTLTLEQLAQKDEKRRRTKEYEIVEEFSGSWCPISHGVGVFFHPPISDEARIPLQKEDRILVTRWKKYWMYGEMVENNAPAENSPQKGWFPRRCGVEVMNSQHCRHYDIPPDSRPQEPTVQVAPMPTKSTSKSKHRKKAD